MEYLLNNDIYVISFNLQQVFDGACQKFSNNKIGHDGVAVCALVFVNFPFIPYLKIFDCGFSRKMHILN